MPEEPKSIDEIEELSRLLDDLNVGRHPQFDNKETGELLAIADFIKKTAAPVCPPQHVLDQTVDRALAEIQAKRSQSSKAWWYSGALSTAVAVMLVVGLNLLPSTSVQLPIAPSQTSGYEPQNTPSIKQDSKQPPLLSQQITPREDVTTPNISAGPVKEALLPAASQPPVSTVPQPPTKSLKPPLMSKAAPIIGEQISPAGQSKSAYLQSAVSDAESAIPPSTIVPLFLPGQVANLIVTDTENGIILQIYHKGTAQEIVITQRPLSKVAVDSKREAPANVFTEAVKDQPSLINTVKVIKFNQEITIEGRQPKQALEKIAETLTK